MRAHYLQHAEFEGLGSIEPWLTQHGYTLSGTHLHRAELPPDPAALDLLVVMGGPMSVNDEARLPWLAHEKVFVRDCIQRGLPVLGVCLGAQLIAAALGARVYRNAAREIGWFPIERVASDASTFEFPARVDVLHWHGETFDLPARAVQLARSAACEQQAFQAGRRVMGLQFHLEMTPHSVRALVAHCRDELTADRYVQDERALLEAPPALYERTHALLHEVLTYLTR